MKFDGIEVFSDKIKTDILDSVEDISNKQNHEVDTDHASKVIN